MEFVSPNTERNNLEALKHKGDEDMKHVDRGVIVKVVDGIGAGTSDPLRLRGSRYMILAVEEECQHILHALRFTANISADCQACSCCNGAPIIVVRATDYRKYPCHHRLYQRSASRFGRDRGACNAGGDSPS